MHAIVEHQCEQAFGNTSVHEALRTAILRGVFAPGAPLVEEHIARELGVSRTLVHQAIVRLEAAGLAATAGGRVYVQRLSLQEIEHISFVRELVECAAVSLACERASEAWLRDMEHFILESVPWLPIRTDGSPLDQAI